MGEIVMTSYLSHGAPTSLVERTGIHDVYESMGRVLRGCGVDTVVVSSPHYVSRGRFEIESRNDIPCIQDYYGFPDELYKFSYEAKNNPALVSAIIREAEKTGITASASESWGLDHGAWLPLYFMFPDRNVKVVPVSITGASPDDHFRFGEAIRAAISRTEGKFAVIGTGSPVHRLDMIRYGYYGPERYEPAAKFDEILIDKLTAGDIQKLLRIRGDNPAEFRAAAPEGNLNPLYIALGASSHEDFLGRTILHEFMYFGVSLIATIVSAREGIREQLLEPGPEAAPGD